MANGQLAGVLHFLRHAIVARDSTGISDADLLERFVTGRDEAAFELIVWRHGRMVLGVCRRVLRDEQEAEDAFQAAFLTLARRAAAIRRRTCVGAWLYRVAYRVALDAQDRAGRLATAAAQLEDVPSHVAGPAAAAEQRDLRRVLDAEVSRLPEKYRVPFVRCCCDGESSAALARELGCPVGTVEAWLTRARRRLRAGLARRGVTAPAALFGTAPAAVQTQLVIATVRSAAAGSVSPRVAVLAEGVLKAMMMTRLKVAAAILVVVATVGLGAGLLAASRPGEPPPGVAPPAAEQMPPPQPAPPPANGDQPAKNATPGRIYIEVVFPPNLIRLFTGSNPSKIVAIDPETGKWTKVSDAAGIVRVSPDTRAVAFLNSKEELWVCDTQGKEKPVRLMEKAGRPNWSPDGKQLVSTKGDVVADDGWKTVTWQVNADGTARTQLKVPDTDFVEDWSSDGKWFVTCSDRHPPRGRGYQLYVMHTEGGGERRLTKGGGLNCYARFSPDGRRIVYLHQERGVNSLHVMDTDGTNDREILKEKDRVRPEYVCWAPDGKRLVVTVITQPRPGATDLLGNPLRDTIGIEIMDPDGGNRKELKLPDAEGAAIQIQGSSHPDWR
jgi:RNA polymerase sigma factor (sigma-70 family)